MKETNRGVGKCENDHTGSFGYPTRPEEPYDFCSQCGKEMVWQCAECLEPVPEDAEELAAARFCRKCGRAYFANGKNRAEAQAQNGKESSG
jgi:hypothetical protein